jgi:NhaP-type Na+/H+ or K+/H+ antiporter
VDLFNNTIALIGIVIVVASLLSGALEKTGIPVVAVFLALGALLGPHALDVANIGLESPSLHALSVLALALVLFSDAATIDTSALRTRGGLVLRVLGPGTLIPATLIALAAWVLLDVPGPAAAILGAALASTDPVLLRAVLRAPALPEGVRMTLRMESGMNDVVLLPIVVIAMILLGPSTVERGLGSTIAGLFVLGPLLGVLVGWVGILALDKIRARFGVRRDYESLYAIGLAFTAFALAEGVGGSGFVAAFAAGLMVAAQDVELCECFLEYGEATAEMLLLLTFVALGTVLIWTGLDVMNGRTLAFAAVALFARTVVLYPVLARTGAYRGDLLMIALFGPRGLSSLLLVLLPVFAGVPGAEELFAIACLVVLLSVVLHGAGIALFLRWCAVEEAAARRVAAVAPAATVVPDATAAPAARRAGRALPILTGVPERITLDELATLRAAGEPIVIVDARSYRNLRADTIKAAGSVRLDPDHPVRDAVAQRLSQHATLVVYCA